MTPPNDFATRLEGLIQTIEGGRLSFADKMQARRDLASMMVNHAPAIARLCRAAERTCVKLMLDDEHELREALAALNAEDKT